MSKQKTVGELLTRYKKTRVRHDKIGIAYETALFDSREDKDLGTQLGALNSELVSLEKQIARRLHRAGITSEDIVPFLDDFLN